MQEQSLRQALAQSLGVIASSMLRGSYGNVTQGMLWNTSVECVMFLLLVVQSRGVFRTHPPVQSPSSQSLGDFRENVSIQSQDGLELSLQTVNGPQTPYVVQKLEGWEYIFFPILFGL